MTGKEIFEGLKPELGDALLGIEGDGLDAVLSVRQASLRALLEKLKSAGFNMLVDLTCVDYSKFDGKPARFRLTYRLLSLDAEAGLSLGRVALACWVEDLKGPPSARDLWPCADWLEREVWDMFGVGFSDRPDMKRILMYEEFSGHPLRKDYPIAQRQPLIGPTDEKPRERWLESDLRPRLA
ncbi:MAG TPA: NADH-quinone oxidoreductase subunit C [Elusimicrobiota bacterium]|nr:NADH-quinone oxidoreductase subunit C [Elusimicrobiota bacterium]